jgi:CheY-like chemotaxis protein
MVWNLLSNAIKFTPSGGRVDVTLGRFGEQVEITVADTGVGIDLAFLPHVFERFRQADSSSTRGHGGLGLGLSIVRQMAEMHGGTAHAHSDGPGHGATLRILLPVAPVRGAASGGESYVSTPESSAAAARPPRTSIDDPPPSALKGVKVLIVEDEADALELLRRQLLDRHAEVFTATNATDALTAFEHAQPHVVISDIGMPDRDGLWLVAQLRQFESVAARAHTPAVAFSAFARPEDRTRAMEAGYDAHLSKPAEPAELITLIANLARANVGGGSR